MEIISLLLSSPSFLTVRAALALPNHLWFLCTALPRWVLCFLSSCFRKFPLVSPHKTLKYPPCVTAMFCTYLRHCIYYNMSYRSYLPVGWTFLLNSACQRWEWWWLTSVLLGPSRHLRLLHWSELSSCCIVCGVRLCHPPSFFTVFTSSATGS